MSMQNCTLLNGIYNIQRVVIVIIMIWSVTVPMGNAEKIELMIEHDLIDVIFYGI